MSAAQALLRMRRCCPTLRGCGAVQATVRPRHDTRRPASGAHSQRRFDLTPSCQDCVATERILLSRVTEKTAVRMIL